MPYNSWNHLSLLIAAIAMLMVQAASAADAPAKCVTRTIVHKDGTISFQDSAVRDENQLQGLYVQYFKQHPHCEMNIVGEGKDVPFAAVGEAIYALQKAGYPKVGFLVEPQNIPAK